MDQQRLARERDTLNRHLRQSQEALEEFKQLHESELSVAQEREEDLVAENAGLRHALDMRDSEFDKLKDAFERLLSLREAQLDSYEPHNHQQVPHDSAPNAHQEAVYDSEEAEQEPFEAPPNRRDGKKLLHARQLAIDLAKELERSTATLDEVQEQRDAAILLLQARQEAMEQLQHELGSLKEQQAQPDQLGHVREQMRMLRTVDLQQLMQASAPRTPQPTSSETDTTTKVLQDIDDQIRQAESTLKALQAERRTLDPNSLSLSSLDASGQLRELQKVLDSREQQLEDLARSAREALEAQSNMMEVHESAQEKLQQEVQQARAQTAELQAQLDSEKCKTQELTNRLEGLVHGLDQATQF